MKESIYQIRHTHRYGFRSGTWATVRGIVPHPEVEGRDCYLVEFEDGVTDFWTMQDQSDPYEFREV